jgi:hypothetical protein
VRRPFWLPAIRQLRKSIQVSPATPFASTYKNHPSQCRALANFIEELGDTSAQPRGDLLPLNARHQALNVLCLPARNEADAILAVMLSQSLERKGLNAHAVPAGKTSEMLSIVSELKPGMTCISAPAIRSRARKVALSPTGV